MDATPDVFDLFCRGQCLTERKLIPTAQALVHETHDKELDDILVSISNRVATY
jgi:hypothetical protein